MRGMETFTLAPRGPFALASSIRFLEGFTPAAYSGPRDAALELAFPVEGSWETVGVLVRQKGGPVTVEVVAPSSPGPELMTAVRAQVERILSLDVDGSGFSAVGERDPVRQVLDRRLVPQKFLHDRGRPVLHGQRRAVDRRLPDGDDRRSGGNGEDGEELPVGTGHGYLWRLNTYWRFEEKDGGVYLQCEALSLTRDMPTGLGWLLKPLVTSIPKQSLNRALGQTRTVVIEEAKKYGDSAQAR